MEQRRNSVFSGLASRDDITGEVPSSDGPSNNVLVDGGEESGNPEKGY